MFDMFGVQFLAKMWCSEVFEVWSCCYVTRLVLELTVWCSWTVRFFVMFKVRFWAKMWCSESSMFGYSMFIVFEVRHFGVHSKTNGCQVVVVVEQIPSKTFFLVEFDNISFHISMKKWFLFCFSFGTHILMMKISNS